MKELRGIWGAPSPSLGLQCCTRFLCGRASPTLGLGTYTSALPLDQISQGCLLQEIYSLSPKINNFLRFKICTKINNALLSPNVEVNYGCMQMITTKFKRCISGKEKNMKVMCLLRTSLICLKISRKLFIMGPREYISKQCHTRL